MPQQHDYQYVAMDSMAFNCLAIMLPYPEYKRLWELREYWRGTYLEIQSL